MPINEWLMDAINYQIKSRAVEQKLINSGLFETEKQEVQDGEEVNSLMFCFRNTIQLERRKDKTTLLVKHHHLYNLFIKNQCQNADFFGISERIESVRILRAIFNLTYEEGADLMPVSVENNTKIIEEKGSRFIEYLSYFGTSYAYMIQGKDNFNFKKNKSFVLDFKGYHKGAQGNNYKYCDYNTISIEEKLKKSRSIQVYYGVTSLQDLEKESTYLLMQSRLIKLASEMLILNSDLDISSLTESEQKEYLVLMNPNTWTKEGLELDCERRKRKYDKNTFQKYKSVLNSIYDKIGVNPHKSIEQKVRESTSLELVKSDKKRKIHHLFNSVSSLIQSYNSSIEIESQHNTIQTTQSIKEIEQLNRFNNSLGAGVKKVCVVTGVSLEIEHKDNADAVYIQTKTLKYLFENNFDKYKRIKKSMLKGSICTPKFESNEFSHIAKQIRNTHYSRLRNIIKPAPNQMQLF